MDLKIAGSKSVNIKLNEYLQKNRIEYTKNDYKVIYKLSLLESFFLTIANQCQFIVSP